MMPPRLEDQYRPRTQSCGCSRCSKYIPSISSDKKESKSKDFWGKYAGPAIFAALISAIALGTSYCQSQENAVSERSANKDISVKLK